MTYSPGELHPSISLVVGIDPGVKTGFAVWCRRERRLIDVATVSALEAMDRIKAMNVAELRFEDARQRTWFGSSDRKQAKYGAGFREGIGSVKRDCALWEDFCARHGIKFKAVKPARGNTKWDAANFKKVTGWQGRTSEHARDAALLVIGG